MSARSMEEPADLDMWLKYVTEKLPYGYIVVSSPQRRYWTSTHYELIVAVTRTFGMPTWRSGGDVMNTGARQQEYCPCHDLHGVQ